MCIYLVTARGLSVDGAQWVAPKPPAFLVPVEGLSAIFSANVCTALKQAG